MSGVSIERKSVEYLKVHFQSFFQNWIEKKSSSFELILTFFYNDFLFQNVTTGDTGAKGEQILPTITQVAANIFPWLRPCILLILSGQLIF